MLRHYLVMHTGDTRAGAVSPYKHTKKEVFAFRRRVPRDAPRHHYAHALMDSNFEPDPKMRKTVTRLDGEIPSPFATIPGCAFAARCPAASKQCHEERPPLTDIGGGHQIACHHPMD